MAQVLKDYVRNDILDSATDVLLQKGIKDASMRDIAKGAKVTVGNLYRYFKSKEDIISTIIRKPVTLINEALERLTNYEISFTKEVSSINIKNEQIQHILEEIADVLVEIYDKYPKETTILLKDEFTIGPLKKWLTNLLNVLLLEKSNIEFSSNELREYYANAVAISVFYGVRECFIEGEIDRTRELVRTYFYSLLSLLKMEE